MGKKDSFNESSEKNKDWNTLNFNNGFINSSTKFSTPNNWGNNFGNYHHQNDNFSNYARNMNPFNGYKNNRYKNYNNDFNHKNHSSWKSGRKHNQKNISSNENVIDYKKEEPNTTCFIQSNKQQKKIVYELE